jgi:hypothetical protein
VTIIENNCLHSILKIGLREFIMVKLTDFELYHVWMGRAENEVVKDEQFDNFKHDNIQWWLTMKKGVNNDLKLY